MAAANAPELRASQPRETLTELGQDVRPRAPLRSKGRQGGQQLCAQRPRGRTACDAQQRDPQRQQRVWGYAAQLPADLPRPSLSVACLVLSKECFVCVKTGLQSSTCVWGGAHFVPKHLRSYELCRGWRAVRGHHLHAHLSGPW